MLFTCIYIFVVRVQISVLQYFLGRGFSFSFYIIMQIVYAVFHKFRGYSHFFPPSRISNPFRDSLLFPVENPNSLQPLHIILYVR